MWFELYIHVNMSTTGECIMYGTVYDLRTVQLAHANPSLSDRSVTQVMLQQYVSIQTHIVFIYITLKTMYV